MNTVSFPGLGIGAFTLDSEAFSIGSISIKWYAVCICLGLILAYIYCSRKAPYFGLDSNDFLDLVLVGVPCGLIGARVGYILMDLDSFDSLSDMIAVWNGGLSIYGGIIGAFLALTIACKIKKISLAPVFDVAAIGIIIGQIVGRWGNFFNIEVYGVQTNLPWRMGIGTNAISEYVHPLFLYESLWNLIGFVLILAFLDQRKFRGEVFLWYTCWYGLGRVWMEALRNSEFQLTIGAFKINQVIALFAIIISVALWVYFRFFKISVHFNSDELEKNMTLKELRRLRDEQNYEKQAEKYQSQFEKELDDASVISEDEYMMKRVFDKLDEMEKEEESNDGKDN